MSEILGFPVIDINAKTGYGIEELFTSVEKQAKTPVDTSKSLTYDAELKSHFATLQLLIEKDEKLLDVPSLWTAIKLLENDSIVIQKVQNSPQSSSIFTELDNVLKQLKDAYDESPEEIIASARYEFIDDLMAKSVEINAVEGETITDKIDNIVLNKFLAFPIFVVLMYIIFEITYNVSTPFQSLIEQGFKMLSEFVAGYITNPYLTSIICDAIIGGVGGVLSFLPILLIIFLFLSILRIADIWQEPHFLWI